MVPGGWEDEWIDPNYHQPRYPRPPYRTRDTDPRYGDRLFAPDWQGAGLHRSRSQGHAPTPHFAVYNNIDMEANPRVGANPPRGRQPHLNEWGDEEARYARSRSRGRSDAPGLYAAAAAAAAAAQRDPSPGVRDYQLQAAQDRLREQEWRATRDKEDELVRKRMELRYMKERMAREEEEARMRAEEDRIKKEFEVRKVKEDAKRDEEAKEAKTTRERAIRDYIEEREAREKERKDAARRAVEEHERKLQEEEREAKEREKRILEKMEREKREKEEKERKAYEEFLLKQERKKKEEEERKKREEEKLQDEMRKRLAEVGFQDNQIKAITDPKKSQALVAGSLPNRPLGVHTPTYVKVHKDHLSIETLQYYDIPWEWDSTDRNFIIILRELDQRDTDALFDHTRQLRNRTMTHLLVEQKPHEQPEYKWVRKRRPSASPKPAKKTSPRRLGLRQIF